MDFHALPRRDLQALCKRNAIRANMSNAAMAEALQGLRSVEGIEEIRKAPPPLEVSTAMSGVAVRKEQHGCPLPGSFIPQAATKGAATRKIEEAATLTPAETLQMSQRNTATGDAPAPVDEAAVSTGKRRKRRSKRSKAKVIPDQDGEAPVAQRTEQVVEPVLFDKMPAVAVENHNGCPLPHGGRGRVTRSKSEAHEMEDAVPALGTSQRTQKTEAVEALQIGQKKSEAQVANVEPFSAGRRRTRKSKRSKAKLISEQDEEAPTAELKEPVTESELFDSKSAVVVEKHNGCLLPHGSLGRVTRSKAEAHEMEDAAPALGTLQRTQKTEAMEALQMSHQKPEAQAAAADVNAEPFSTGKRRIRKSKRPKAKVISEQDREAPAAELKEPVTVESVLFDDKSAVVMDKHNGCLLPHGGRGRITRSNATAHEAEDAAVPEATMPVEVEEVPMGKRRNRRSRRSKAKLALDEKEEEPAAAEHTKLKAESSDAAIQPAVILEKSHDDLKEDAVIDEEATEPQERETHYANPSSAMRRTRRSRRQKVKMASDKKEEVAGAVIKDIIAVISEKRCDDLKEEAIDKEATKPQEGEIHHDNKSSAMRRTRRSRRHKVKMASDKKEEVAGAVTKELIAALSDGGIGSEVVSDKSCNDFDDEKVSLVELPAINFQQGIADEMESISNDQKSPSVVTRKDLPIGCVLSRAESRGPVIEMAQDYSVKGGSDVAESFVGEVTFKMNHRTRNRKDGFIFTGEMDQSNLLVNTLDKFEKPIYNYVVKKEKKEGECWWMLI